MSFWAGLSYAPYPILGTRARMMEAVADFRAWAKAASSDPEWTPGYAWECGYEFWSVLTAVFCKYLDASDPGVWDGGAFDALLYILGRDNMQGVLCRELSIRSAYLLRLAEVGTGSDELEARRQIADALGEAELDAAEAAEAVRFLRMYIVDDDAYVRLCALRALARRGAPDVEALARRIWIRRDNRDRIGALLALEVIGSPHLTGLLAVAERDGDEDLREHARTIAARSDDHRARADASLAEPWLPSPRPP